MRRTLSLDGRDFALEARSEDGGSALSVRIEGVEGEASALPAPGGWSVRRGRRTEEAGVTAGARGEVIVQVGGETFRFEARPAGMVPRIASGTASGGTAGAGQRRSSGGRCDVRTPMPGRVVRVLRKPGDPVEAGEGIIVLEAMKMQNEIPTPEPGVVANILVAAGSPLEGGELLFVVEPASSP